VRLRACNTADGQQKFTPGPGNFFNGDRFEIVGSNGYCVTQDTQPKSGEVLKAKSCSTPRRSSTSYWYKYTTQQANNVLKYYPGLLNVVQNGLLLSEGLTARVIATTGFTVQYDTGGQSAINFHNQPDFGTTFVDTRPGNEGGWIFPINAEVNSGGGGVGAITFDVNGNVIGYEMLLTGTSRNCGGGPTPWNTWISCEEAPGGQNWQVDPTGVRTPSVITLGNDGGLFESFAYELVAQGSPMFFVTEDRYVMETEMYQMKSNELSHTCRNFRIIFVVLFSHSNRGSSTGAPLRRWRPDAPVNWNDPWNILHGSGTTDYLLINDATKTFSWTSDKSAATANANTWYPGTEGPYDQLHLLFGRSLIDHAL